MADTDKKVGKPTPDTKEQQIDAKEETDQELNSQDLNEVSGGVITHRHWGPTSGARIRNPKLKP